MKRMRSVPPAEFEREAAALSPSKTLSTRRPESIVHPVSRPIAVRSKPRPLILRPPKVLGVAMGLSSRHRFTLLPYRMLHHRLHFQQGFCLGAGARGETSWRGPKFATHTLSSPRAEASARGDRNAVS